jgi:hypothetical protein|tara:strand:+ start:506 stop:700 length:195 start_codon:yes stop_codon:yes gene_type:complete
MKILKPLLATTFVAKTIPAVGKKNHPASALVIRNVKLNRKISRKRASTCASINAWPVLASNQIT